MRQREELADMAAKIETIEKRQAVALSVADKSESVREPQKLQLTLDNHRIQ